MTYRTRKRSRSQDKGNSHASFVMLVPERQVVDQTWKQTSLEDTKKKSNRRNSAKVVRGTQAHGHDTPTEHEKRKPATGAKPLKKNVAGYFKHCIGD